jgi:hypothetical protein
MLRIDELESKSQIDTKCFIIYDNDEDLFYLYGSRKNTTYPNHCVYNKCFSSMRDLHNFLKIVMSLELDDHNVNTYVYHVPYATSEDNFDTYLKKCNPKHEITGYNKVSLKSFKDFSLYLSALM